MNKLLIMAICLNSVFFANAQKEVVIEESVIDTTPPTKLKNQKLVTVRLSGDKATNEKIVVEIDGNKIKVNGKDIADLKDVEVNIGETRLYLNGRKGTMNRINEYPIEMYNEKRLQLNDKLDALNNKRNELFERRENLKRGIIHNTSKAVLGIGMEKVSSGVKVTEVTEESGAQKAGLQEGDIITKINDKVITNEMDITGIVSKNKPNSTITIGYSRDGKNKTTTATLGERKDDFSFNGMGSFNGEFPMEMHGMPPMQNFDFKFDGNMPDMKVFEFPKGDGQGYYFNNTPKLGASLMETEDGKGLEVTAVQEGSVIAKAGLQKGDIVTMVGEKSVATVNDVKAAVKENMDKPFTIEYLRNGKAQKAQVKFPKKLKEVSL